MAEARGTLTADEVATLRGVPETVLPAEVAGDVRDDDRRSADVVDGLKGSRHGIPRPLPA